MWSHHTTWCISQFRSQSHFGITACIKMVKVKIVYLKLQHLCHIVHLENLFEYNLVIRSLFCREINVFHLSQQITLTFEIGYFWMQCMWIKHYKNYLTIDNTFSKQSMLFCIMLTTIICGHPISSKKIVDEFFKEFYWV